MTKDADWYALAKRDRENTKKDVYNLAVEKTETDKKIKDFEKKLEELRGLSAMIDNRGVAVTRRLESLESEIAEYEKTNGIKKDNKI